MGKKETPLQIASRLGGSHRPIRMVDAESGKVMRDDSDMLKLIKFSVARGAGVNEAPLITSIDKWVEKNWQEDIACPHCSAKTTRYITSIYIKGWRCWSCWKDVEATNVPDDKQDLVIKSTQFIDEYCSFKINDRINQKNTVLRYIKEVLGQEVEDANVSM